MMKVYQFLKKENKKIEIAHPVRVYISEKKKYKLCSTTTKKGEN